jgi:hypothetical protein
VPEHLSDDDRRFMRAFNTVETWIEDRYQLPVVITDVLDPNTGDFDGVTIKLDYRNDLEVALFVLAHLFGHTVQWATDERARWLGTCYAAKAPPDALFEEIRIYEQNASRLAMQLFIEAGVTDLDQWLTDWAAADWEFLAHFYRTGDRVDFRRFFRPGQPRLEPLTIPPFRPQRWVSRFSF